MKKRLIRIVAAVLIGILSLGSSMGISQAASAANPFTDVKESDYFYEPVMWAVENGITTGVSATQFGATSICTRAQVVTFLWRFAGKPVCDTTETEYTDISTSSYYYDALCWAIDNDIISEITGKNFGPNVNVTRGEFLTYLHRMMGSPESTIANPFLDVREGDTCFDAAVWAYEVGVTNGTSTTQVVLNGDAVIYRTQVVTFLWRARDIEPEKEVQPEEPDVEEPETKWINAAEYGLSPDNAGYDNSMILQDLVNEVSANGGGTIYIPAGEYIFCEIGTQAIGSHCIKMASGVNIIGDGEETVLRPMGASSGGLDMFYFNNLLDKMEPLYLEDCNFENFVIDGEATSSAKYTSAGKGFMINLFKNCNWKNVIVKNTDATGFGVDCPIGGSIVDCIAINCGKAATTSNGGASGFGIGFGYSEDEYFTISNCQSYDNKKFGFFFEHQERFSKKYAAKCAEGFLIKDCVASGNYYNFGGLLTMDTTYENCVSSEAVRHGYFFENSKNCLAVNCTSDREANTSFVILQSGGDGGNREVTNVVYDGCTSTNTSYGVKVSQYTSTAVMKDNVIKNCSFSNNTDFTAATVGKMEGLTLTGNTADVARNSFEATIIDFVNVNNSWN